MRKDVVYRENKIGGREEEKGGEIGESFEGQTDKGERERAKRKEGVRGGEGREKQSQREEEGEKRGREAETDFQGKN